MIISLISFVYSGDTPIIQDLVVMKNEYFTAYPGSKITFSSVESSPSTCILDSGSRIFYKSDTHMTKKNISTNLMPGSVMYFHPEQYATVDLRIYPQCYINKDGVMLEVDQGTKECIVKIVNNENVVLKNMPSETVPNAFVGVVSCENPRVILDCVLESSQIQCKDTTNSINQTIYKGENIKCIFRRGIPFFPFSPSSFLLKSFTQFQSNEKHCRVSLISDTVFLPGEYITTCFSDIIKIPALQGRIIRKPTSLPNEYSFIFDPNIVKKYAGSAWMYRQPSDTVITPPFHQEFIEESARRPRSPDSDNFFSHTSTSSRFSRPRESSYFSQNSRYNSGSNRFSTGSSRFSEDSTYGGRYSFNYKPNTGKVSYSLSDQISILKLLTRFPCLFTSVNIQLLRITNKQKLFSEVIKNIEKIVSQLSMEHKLLTIDNLSEYRLTNVVKSLKLLSNNLHDVSTNLTAFQEFQDSLCKLIDTVDSNISEFTPYI